MCWHALHSQGGGSSTIDHMFCSTSTCACLTYYGCLGSVCFGLNLYFAWLLFTSADLISHWQLFTSGGGIAPRWQFPTSGSPSVPLATCSPAGAPVPRWQLFTVGALVAGSSYSGPLSLSMSSVIRSCEVALVAQLNRYAVMGGG